MMTIVQLWMFGTTDEQFSCNGVDPDAQYVEKRKQKRNLSGAGEKKSAESQSQRLTELYFMKQPVIHTFERASHVCSLCFTCSSCMSMCTEFWRVGVITAAPGRGFWLNCLLPVKWPSPTCGRIRRFLRTSSNILPPLGWEVFREKCKTCFSKLVELLSELHRSIYSNIG